MHFRFAPFRFAYLIAPVVVIGILIAGASAEEPAGLRIEMTDGSIIVGVPLAAEFEVVSASQRRRIAFKDVLQIVPGTNHLGAAFENNVKQLATGLGDTLYATRESSHAALMKLGPAAIALLKAYENDADLERRTRVRKIIGELKKSRTIDTRRLDQIIQAEAVHEGVVAGEHLKIRSPWGKLTVPWSDILVVCNLATSRPVNLLANISVVRDAIRGKWRIAGGVLTTPTQTPWALLQLKHAPPKRYSLHITAKRLTGADALVFPLVVGGRECNVCIDGWPRSGRVHTGLELIDGHGPLTNQTRHRGTLLAKNKTTVVVIDVSPTSVRLTINGKQIFFWQGDPAKFSMQPGWTRPDKTVPAIGCYNAQFQITRLDLIPSAAVQPTRLKPGAKVMQLKNGARLVFPSKAPQIDRRTQTTEVKTRWGVLKIPFVDWQMGL